MRKRCEIAGCADRSLARDDRCDVVIEAFGEQSQVSNRAAE
jgi:hypothetical protein